MTGTEVRAFLRANMATIDRIYLDHEAGVLAGIHHCHCGYRCNEAEWLQHVADKIADAINPVLELPDQLMLA